MVNLKVSFFLLSLVFLISPSFSKGSQYGSDLLSAGSRLLPLLPQESSEEYYNFRREFFTYITHSEEGKRYFLHTLQLWHEVLNEANVKKVLDWMRTEGVDVDSLFSVRVPQEAFESLQGQGQGQGQGSSGMTVLALPPLMDLLDMEAMFSTCLELLWSNEGVKTLYKKISNPSLLLGIYKVGMDPKYKDVREEVMAMIKDEEQGGGKHAYLGRVIKGLFSMLNLKGDRRALSPLQRFVEGGKVMMGCQVCEDYKCERVCSLLDKYQDKHGGEL